MIFSPVKLALLVALSAVAQAQINTGNAPSGVELQGIISRNDFLADLPPGDCVADKARNGGFWVSLVIFGSAKKRVGAPFYLPARITFYR